MRTGIITTIAIICLMVACSSNEIGNSKDVNPQTIFTRYTVSYAEGDENAECFAQFTFAGDNGITLILNDPAGILLDGSSMKLDSSDMSGAYYILHPRFNSFAGKHNFTFLNMDGKSYGETFEFIPFSLAQGMSSSIQKSKPLSIPINGLADGENLQLIITDTASDNKDINRTDTIRNGRLLVMPDELEQLYNGPVTIKIRKLDSHPLKQSTNEGGIFEAIYSLKDRECLLDDYKK